MTGSAAPDSLNPTSRRERKKQATRDAVRAAALDLFSRDSFASVTVEQVCDLADVAPSTFFRHYATKEDVVLAGLVDRGAALLDALRAQPAGVSWHDLLVGAVDDWGADRRPPEELRAEVGLLVSEPALLARLDRMLVAWEQPIGDLFADRSDLDPAALDVRLAAAWFVSTVRVIIREWALSGGTDDVVVFARGPLARFAVVLEDTLSPTP
jgi:AcrR family transcriptional regulator